MTDRDRGARRAPLTPRLLAAGALLAMVAAACSGGDAGSGGSASVDTRPSATPTTGVGVNFDTPPPSTPGTRKSAPRWAS